MAKRMGWTRLSDNYRAQLVKAGITQSSYESGVSLKAARRHENTPERPLPANKPVEPKFQKWYNQRYNSPIKMLTDEGEKWLVSVSKSDRSIIGSHWEATRKYLWGDERPIKAKWWSGRSENALDWFEGKTVRGSELDDDGRIDDPKIYHFLTDKKGVEDWTHSDVLSFTTIYKNVAVAA
jgi:hypothetical protein